MSDKAKRKTARNLILLSPREFKEFQRALDQPVRLTAAQKNLGKIMHGEV